MAARISNVGFVLGTSTPSATGSFSAGNLSAGAPPEVARWLIETHQKKSEFKSCLTEFPSTCALMFQEIDDSIDFVQAIYYRKQIRNALLKHPMKRKPLAFFLFQTQGSITLPAVV